MKTSPATRLPMLLIAALPLAACSTHDRAASRPPARSDTRVVYTGSHIPQPPNEVTTSPLSATTPPESVSRHPDSLVPTEPVVGATDNNH